MRLLAFLFLPLAISQPLATNLDRANSARPGEPAANILFRSDDGGKTWQNLSRGLPEDMQSAHVLSQNGSVFIGTINGSVYHSENPETGAWEGGSVGDIFMNTGTNYSGEFISGLFPGSSGPYACLYENGFYRKISGTNLWQPLHEALADKKVHTVLEKPDGTILVGSSSGIYASSDDGKTWRHLYNEGPVNSLAGTGQTLIASGPRGLLRSTDGGEHWSEVLPDEGGIYQTSLIGDRFAAVRLAGPWRSAGENGSNRAYTSADDGMGWQRLDANLPDQALSPIQEVYDLRQAGEFLFCCHKAGISCSTDGGQTWELVHPATIAGEKVRFNLAVSGRTVYAVVVRGGC